MKSVRVTSGIVKSSAAASLMTASALAAAQLSAVLPASAATPTTVSHMRVAAVTPSSFTVTLSSLGAGWRYRVYASTRKSDVYYTNLAKAPHTSALSARPSITIGGLGFTAAPYWFRIQAIKGSSHRTGPMSSVGLRPAAPTSVSVGRAAGGGLAVTWQASSNGFDIQQSTNPAFTSGVRTYTTRGAGGQFTPYGLSRGVTYYFRVRARNTATVSAFSPAVHATETASAQPVRVMTYNILAGDSDGQREGDGTVAPWSQRRLAAARNITSAAPDVIGIQEGASWVGAARGPRQVDDLATALGGTYAVARTEALPGEPGWFRNGCYILYKRSAYSAVGSGWHFDLGAIPGGHRWAAYQVLRNRTTGAKFLFVSPHLYVNAGSTGDLLRRNETASMIAQATAYARSHGNLPVVYAGDFNSHQGHPLDGPAVAARAAHVADGLLVAQSLANAQYNSANQYLRAPKASGYSIDHIYASPGVAITSWRIVLRLRAGLFDGVIASDHNPVVADVVLPY